MKTTLERYADFYARLTSERLDELDELVTDDVRFRDPFNDVTGRAQMRRVLEAMLADVAELEIDVTHCGMLDGAGDDHAPIGAMRWVFAGRLVRAGGRPWRVTGMSELRFADDGRIAAHLDHWDAASGLYEQLPWIGRFFAFVRRRAAGH